MCFRGGGNRRGTRDIVREIELAAKQLGSEAAKVGRHCYADSETKEVSEIKDAKAIRRKVVKFVSEKDAIGRHSERLAYHKGILPRTARLLAYDVSKESSLLQYKAAAKNKNNLTETDQASMPLGIFASKSASDVGIAMPTYFKNLAAKTLHKCMKYKPMLLQRATCVAPLPSCLAAKKSAFTLAEVLITLGIIGVVAALTIPNVVSNYKKKVVETRLAKLYSVLNQAVELSEEKNGACTTWEWGDVDKARNSKFLEYWWKTYMADYIPSVDSVKTPNNSGSTGGYMVFFKDGTGLRIEAIVSQYIWVVIYVNPKFNKQKFVSGAYRDLVSMVSGRDYFSLYLWPERGCSFDLHFYNNLSRSELIEGCKNPYPYGAHCLYLIKNNGWKIPDDYPIKF